MVHIIDELAAPDDPLLLFDAKARPLFSSFKLYSWRMLVRPMLSRSMIVQALSHGACSQTKASDEREEGAAFLPEVAFREDERESAPGFLVNK